MPEDDEHREEAEGKDYPKPLESAE